MSEAKGIAYACYLDMGATIGVFATYSQAEDERRLDGTVVRIDHRPFFVSFPEGGFECSPGEPHWLKLAELIDRGLDEPEDDEPGSLVLEIAGAISEDQIRAMLRHTNQRIGLSGKAIVIDPAGNITHIDEGRGS